MNLMTGQPTDRLDHLRGQLATLKPLTKDQFARCNELRNQQRPCRRLLEAPAGWGKTFIALKLRAHELREQQATARKHWPLRRRRSCSCTRARCRCTCSTSFALS